MPCEAVSAKHGPRPPENKAGEYPNPRNKDSKDEDENEKEQGREMRVRSPAVPRAAEKGRTSVNGLKPEQPDSYCSSIGAGFASRLIGFLNGLKSISSGERGTEYGSRLRLSSLTSLILR